MFLNFQDEIGAIWKIEFWEGDVQNSLLEEQAYCARFLGDIES